MLNLCQFIGNLGKDPEKRRLQSGEHVVNFSVAASERWKDKQGQQQERTEWVNCVAFGKLAEICSEYLAKGSKVYVSGKMRTRKWQAQDGSDRYSTEIALSEMKMLDSRSQGGGEQRSQGASQGASGHSPQQSQPNYDDFDDDIPF